MATPVTASSASPLRVGLVGLGGHGRALQHGVEGVPDIRVATVFDLSEPEALASAERFGCTAAPSFEALLETTLDAVVLATPNAVHRAQAEAALGAGLDVFVEKPIANTVADATAIVDAADAAGRVLMVGHNVRYGRAAREAKARIDRGDIGRVVSVEIHYSADNVQKGYGGWRFHPDTCPLLPMMQLGIHAVDTAQYLVGPVREAVAHTRSVLTPSDVVDTVAALLAFESGVVGTAVSTYCTPDLFQIRVAGTSGVAVVDWIPHRLTLLSEGSRTSSPEVVDYGAYAGEDVVRELQEFADAVRDRRAPETDGRAGLAALAVVEAMAESAAQGRRVVL